MATYAQTKTVSNTLVKKPSASLIGLLIVEIVVGYEWFMSGLAKFVRGDFASDLADELADKAKGASGYATFLNSFVIPHARIFGYTIETAEVLVGIAFIVGPLLWLFARQRVSDSLWAPIFLLTVVAAIGGVFMAINFHIANGNTHPWLIAADSFDEGVDFDAFLAVMNTLIAGLNIYFLSHLRPNRV